jgi:hypothetical protein
MKKIFTFPNPVNEYAARTVATGVVLLSVVFLASGSAWLLALLGLGFLARVASGPRFSPLGLLASKVIAPRLSAEPKLTPGPPKRFAQAIGFVFSAVALALYFAAGVTAASVVIAMLTVAASLEAFAGFCLGCKVFGLLMRIGVIPASVCEECGDLSLRYPELSGTAS